MTIKTPHSPSHKSKCPHCGNNPVIHPLAYINQSIALFMAPFDDWFMNSALGYRMRLLYNSIHRFMIGSMRLLGIASFYSDMAKIPSKRGEVLWKEALRRNIPIQGVSLYGKPLDMYYVRIKNKPLIYMGLPRKEARYTQTRIDDKAYLKKKLEAANVSTSRGSEVQTLQEALSVFDLLEKPVIVKPQLGSRGRHTTTNIRTKDDLRKAFRIAQKLCRSVIVEEHLYGSVYRGTVIGGKLRGVLRGDPPRVTGDGTQNIAELIETKNRARDSRISEISITPLMEAFLKRQGFILSDVLPKSKTIDLSEKIGVGYGGGSKELFEETHPAIKEALEKAAAVVADDILGFDFIIEDPTKDPRTQKWGIIECNTVPFINLHHYPVEGTPRNIAKHVWDLWEG